MKWEEFKEKATELGAGKLEDRSWGYLYRRGKDKTCFMPT